MSEQTVNNKNSKTPKISNKAMVVAAFKKFPWLRKTCNEAEVYKVTYTSLTNELLSADCGFLRNMNGGMLDWYATKPIYFFDENGDRVARVGIGYSGPLGEIRFAENLGEAIARLEADGALSRVRHIVGLHREKTGKTKSPPLALWRYWVPFFYPKEEEVKWSLMISPIPANADIRSCLDAELKNAESQTEALITAASAAFA